MSGGAVVIVGRKCKSLDFMDLDTKYNTSLLPVDEISFDGRKWNRGHHLLPKFNSQWCPLFHFLPSKLISSPGTGLSGK